MVAVKCLLAGLGEAFEAAEAAEAAPRNLRAVIPFRRYRLVSLRFVSYWHTGLGPWLVHGRALQSTSVSLAAAFVFHFTPALPCLAVAQPRPAG